MQSRRALFLLVLATWLAGCTPDNGFLTREVDRADYGDRWPLTVDAAVLACEPGGAPTVTVNGTTYGLHQTGLSGSGSERIWVEDRDGEKKDTAELRRDALALFD